MRRTWLAPLGALALSGCALPERDNGHDPAVRPSAAHSVYVLQPTAPDTPGAIVVAGGSYEAIVRDFGFSDTIFLIDARASTDPDDAESSLSFSWNLAGVDLATEEMPCPDGEASDACRLILPAQLSGVTRNAAIPLVVRVEDPGNHSDEEAVDARLLDQAPIADAGPDWVVPLSADTFHVVLDGAGSFDLDPEGTGALATHCWEQVLPSVPLAVTVEVSSAGACPGTGAQWTVARSLSFDAPASPGVDGRPPFYRFRLHVRDGYAWSEPDSVEVEVGPSALWTIHAVPAIGERRAPGFFRIGDIGNGGNRPLIATGKDETDAIAITNQGQSFSAVDRIGTDGSVERLAQPLLTEANGAKTFRGAATDGSTLWAAADANDSTDTLLVTLSLVDTSAAIVTTPFTGHPAPDLVVIDPACGAWGARTGNDFVWRYDVNGGDVEETVGMTALGSPVNALEIGADGTLFVGTEDFLVVRTAAGGRIDVDGLVPTALRLEEGPVAGSADDRLWVGDAVQGILSVAQAALLGGVAPAAVVVPGVRDARRLRLSPDGGLWVTRIGSGEILRLDRDDGSELASFVVDAPVTGAAGTSLDGGLFVTFPALTVSGVAIARIPLDDGETLGRTESVGSIRDLSTERGDGGAWVAVESPPSVAQVDARGIRHAETIFDELGGAGFFRPWRIAADNHSRGLWMVERPIDSQVRDSHWHVAERAAPGIRATPVSRGFAVETERQLYRLRAAGENGSGRLRAWALDYRPGDTEFNVVEAVENLAAGIDFSRIPVGAVGTGGVAGPAVAPDNTAWVAACGPPGAFNPTSNCPCTNSSIESQCQVGTHLAWVEPGGTALTELALPANIDLGRCGGFACSVFPLDIAFDPQRNVAWVATIDFVDGPYLSPYLRAARLACTDGGPLQDCAPADLVGWTTESSASSELELPLQLNQLQGIMEQRSDLLGVDEATGLAYFIDPVDGDILLLNARTSYGTNVIDVSLAARSTTARRLAIGR